MYWFPGGALKDMFCRLRYVRIATLTPIGCQWIEFMGPGLSEPVFACVLAQVGLAEYSLGEFVGGWAKGGPIDEAKSIVI